MHRRTLAFAPAVVLFLLDRLTKWWVETGLPPYETRVVIPGFFDLVHARNQGAAFSIFAEASSAWRTAFLLVVSGAVLLLVAGFLWRASAPGSPESRLLRAALSVVLGGALGNLYDRLLHGGIVTDFLDFHLGEWHWPAFNVADSAITVGAALLLLDLWRARRRART